MKKNIALLLLASSAILASCGIQENPSSTSSSSSSSSSSQGTSSSVAPKKNYSLQVTSNYDKVKVVDLNGDELQNEYEEDTLVSFKVLESEKYSVRIYLNDCRLKEKEGVYSFLMARDSVLSIDASDKTFKVHMEEDEAAKLLFTNEDGTILDSQNGEYVVGSDVYFTLDAKAGKNVAFYTTCYRPILNGEELHRNENGVYKISSLAKDETLTLQTGKHQFDADKCKVCEKDAKTTGIFAKNTAKMEYNAALGGWKIEWEPDTKSAELVIGREYLEYLFGDSPALEFTFGNGKKFGYTAAKGYSIAAAVNFSTHGAEGGNIYDNTFRPLSYGSAGEDQLSTVSLPRSVMEANNIDGNLYIYVDFGNNPSTDEANPIPYFFIYGIEAEKEPALAELLPSHNEGYDCVSEFVPDCGIKLTKVNEEDPALRSILAKRYLSYFKGLGKSKMKLVFSEPFDGSQSSLAQTLFSVGTKGGAFSKGDEKGYLAHFVEIGSYEKGSFENNGKTITTYTVTYDLKAAYGENWDSDDILFQFGVHFDHPNKLKDKSAYVHDIAFIE